MKNIIILSTAFFFSILSNINAQQPKIISDCTITFSVSALNNSKHNDLGSKTIYVKGKDIRIDFVTNIFNQTIFINGNTGNATVLKNAEQSKYISNYTASEWGKENEMYSGIETSFPGETKNILNYTCKQAILKLKNGSSYIVYYTPELKLSVSENPFEFKNIPGLILEYESSSKANDIILYTAEKIDFDPVPALQFEIPKKGYRILH